MEAKINIAEILKDKPQGTKLYSPICGECKLSYIESEKLEPQISTESDAFGVFYFWDDGKAYNEGECLLFPSDKMRDWAKFAWKKGDVLTNSSGFQIFFDKWLNEDYTEFLGKIKLLGDSHCYDTAYYTLVSEEEALEFIKSVEEINNGKLNRETLEIEKQTEFKDGDIVAIMVRKCTHIAIFQSRQEAYIGFHAVLCQNDELLLEEPFREDVGDIELRLATDSEKQQLFSSLANKGKAWDSEKKEVVDLKPKCEFKPFDKVVVFDELAKKWECGMFSHYSKNYEGKEVIICIGGCTYFKALPFNEETAHLLGTTDNWEGGEQ